MSPVSVVDRQPCPSADPLQPGQDRYAAHLGHGAAPCNPQYNHDASLKPSQFYTGLVADLYEPLASERAHADDYAPFLDRRGTPALELGCGSGHPLLELVKRGYDVEGLDASQDMLDLCRAGADALGLEVTLHLGEMQSFDLPRRYRSIFVASESFTLLTTDEDAVHAARRIHSHLEPGGCALITLEIPDPRTIRASLGQFREVTKEDGTRLRVAVVGLETSTDGRTLSRRLRYERVPTSGEPELLERVWQTRWWSKADFARMLRSAGFKRVRLRAPTVSRTRDGRFFSVLAQRALA